MTGCSPGYPHDRAIDALSGIGARYVGVNSGTGSLSSHVDMLVVAEGTGSVDPSGTPYVFDISSDGSGLEAQIVDAVEVLADLGEVELTTALRDDPADTVDTVEAFIDSVEPSLTGGWPDPMDPTVICVGGLEVGDRYDPLDGEPDTFTSVASGTPVCFDIYVQGNETVPAIEEDQLFTCEIDVVVNGEVADTRSIYFLVPAAD
jgi:hypothetical protein